MWFLPNFEKNHPQVITIFMGGIGAKIGGLWRFTTLTSIRVLVSDRAGGAIIKKSIVDRAVILHIHPFEGKIFRNHPSPHKCIYIYIHNYM